MHTPYAASQLKTTEMFFVHETGCPTRTLTVYSSPVNAHNEMIHCRSNVDVTDKFNTKTSALMTLDPNTLSVTKCFIVL